MAKEKFVFIVDLGSSKLRAIIAGKGLNNTFIIKAYKEVEYDGFYEGKFLNQEKLASLLENIVTEFDIESSVGYDKIYIGVPAEFSSVSRSDVSINFGDKRKIKKQDIESLFYMAGEKTKHIDVEVVCVNAISFALDDGRNVSQPIGESAMSISGKLSVIYVKKEFVDIFNSIVASLGFEQVEYISDPLSQALFLLPKEKREDLSLIIDVGDLTTSIAFVKGDGLYGLTSFSRGGGFITNDLAEAFDLTMGEADRLKRQIVLSLKGKQSDFYELTSDDGKIIRLQLNSVNEVVSYRIEELAQVIGKCTKLYTSEYITYLPIILTGSALTKIKGGRDYLAKCLGKNISYGLPPIPGKDKPSLASILSLTSYALNEEN